MRKLKYIIFLVFLLIFPFKVRAVTNDFSFSCQNKKYTPSSTVICHLWGPAFENFQGNLSFNHNYLTYTNSYLTGNYVDNGSNYVLNYSSTGNNMYDQIAEYQFVVNSDTPAGTYSISIGGVYVKYSNSESEWKTSTYGDLINVVSATTTTTTTKNTNSSNTYTITFNPNGGSGSNQTLSCTPSGSSCSISLNSLTKPIKTGYNFTGWSSNTSCQSLSTTTYRATGNATLYACYSPSNATTTTTIPASTSLYLKSLSIDDQKLDFNKLQNSYSLKVLYSISSLKINAVPEDSTTTTDLKSSYDLDVGTNNIVITLTNGSKTASYTIKVTRLKEGELIKTLSSDASLSNINIPGYNLSFDSTVTNYDLLVDYGTKSLTISATTTDSNARYTVAGNTDITDGSIVTVSVTAEDGTTNVYKINIKVKTIIEQYKIYIIAFGVIIFLILIYFIVKGKQNRKTKKIENTSTKIPTANKIEKTVSKPTPKLTESSTVKTVVKPAAKTVVSPAAKTNDTIEKL
jgi:uncharacterized repeat protein (TIGR02543 family)